MAGFDALVLSRAMGVPVALAKIIYGDNWATFKDRTHSVSGQVGKVVSKMATLLSAASPPDFALNRHCPECEFRDRCKKKAIEKDDLSLLTGLREREKVRLNRKGIFTVSQLSYTFRPRRRAKRLAARPEKYHHSLKALAIREKKIHVVGNPQLRIQGTPVFFDVEGLPDRDFYYLIGVSVGTEQGARHHSLWADEAADEEKIWRGFLDILSAIDNPVLLHYGSFETTFIRKMSDRYGKPSEDSAAGKAIMSSVNLLSVIFARVYFPSYSNGLKETARFLGFEWADTLSSGLQSIVWRHQWEESRDSTIREKLIAYNADDCVALNVVAQSIGRLTGPGVGVDGSTVERPELSMWNRWGRI